MRENPIRDRSYDFALRVIRLSRELESRREHVLSRQVLKAGTSIGANVVEALAAQSRRDFISKMSIASKEARECNYWLRLITDSGLLLRERLQPLTTESEELILILTSIVKSARERDAREA